MTIEPVDPPANSETKTDKTKNPLSSLDIEDDDASTTEDDLALSEEDQLATTKLVARRKIEMYWEKKRLKEQLGEFDDADLDF